MLKLQKYDIICSDKYESFSDKINDKLRKGYVLLPKEYHPSNFLTNSSAYIYVQPMGLPIPEELPCPLT